MVDPIGGDAPDPGDADLERRLRHGAGGAPLPPPAGAYGAIRRRAAVRRWSRAGAGVAVLAAVLAVPVLRAAGGGEREVVIQPAESVAPPIATASPDPDAGGDPGIDPDRPPGPGSTPTPGGAGPGPGAPTGAPSAGAGDPGTAEPPADGSPRCAAAVLDLTLGQMDAGAGNRYLPLIFTNDGDVACHLQGYPGASLLDAAGNQVGPAAVYEEGNEKSRLELLPGASVSTVLHWASDGNPPCNPESTSLRVYPPGDTQALVVPLKVTLCEGDSLRVRHLVAGTEGGLG